ncbi:MAG: hypothetical protein LBK53_03250 [Heliobacteriaceae bacterium]|jgi:hypothetical protein|nr:hypothetical protein [Heliobacteriaceae bacterium]
MGLLVFASRKLSLLNAQNRIEYRITQLTKKLQDLQHYASNIADGNISFRDLMDVPGSMFGRQLMFMQYAHNASIMGAQQQMMNPMMQQQIMQMTQQNPQMQPWYQNYMFQNLYKQQREQIAKQEEKTLNQQEKDITAEKTRLETELKLISQEYDATKQAESKAIERWKPEYTGG